jgi:hypothetical protein
MGRTRGKRGVLQVEDASGIMEVERAQDWENVLMGGNTPFQARSVNSGLDVNVGLRLYPRLPLLQTPQRGIPVDSMLR